MNTTQLWQRTGRIGKITLVGLALLLNACSHNVNPDLALITTPVTTPLYNLGQGGKTTEPTLLQFTPSPNGTVAPSITSTAESDHRTHYEISASLDYIQRSAIIDELVTFKNPLDHELQELVFIVEPNRYPNGFELLKAEDPSGATSISSKVEGNLLFVGLEPGMPAGAKIQLAFQFDLNLPAIPPPSEQYKPQPYGFTDRQTNLVDWYLFLPPLDLNGEWIFHKPSYFGEYLVYPAADFKIDLEVPNAPDSLLVAASGRNLSNQQNRYVYEIAGARSLAISLNSGYEVIEKITRGVTVRSYFKANEKAAGEEALNATAGALEVFSDIYGPYPYDTLSVVEADFLDGMEYDGLYFLSNGFYNLYDGTPKGYLTIIAVHETAHQWWYAQVGNDQALEPWLDEGWCTFSELLYYETRSPELVDWWWYYRVNYYEPVGFIDLPVYDYSGFTPYRNAVYLRGAKFLNDLRTVLGTEQFFTATRSYLAKYSGRISTTQGFLQEFNLNPSNYQELLSGYFKPVE